MTHYAENIAPYLRVAIVDKDYVFRRRLDIILELLSLHTFISVTGDSRTVNHMLDLSVDLAFIEIDDQDHVWQEIESMRSFPGLIVGTSYQGVGRLWLQAIRSGADTILNKQYYPHLLRPMLSRLFASPAAKRCKIVPIAAGERHC